MRILIIGLGSIGQRHIQNIKKIFGDAHKLYALRSTQNNLVIQNGEAKSVNDLSNFYGFQTIKNIDEATNLQPDAVFITNPTHLHVKFAEIFASINSAVFVEKPLSVNYSQAKKFINKFLNSDIYVAYQSAFDPCFLKLKEIVSSNILGRLISVRSEWGTFLPSHHPYENYLTSYAANEEMGGGVTRGLSHEIFMLVELFGKPKSVYARYPQINGLSSNTDETVMSLLEFERDKMTFTASIFLSYSQIKENRDMKLQFERGFVCANFLENIVEVRKNYESVPVIHDFSDLKRNDIFLSEIKYFFDFVSNKNKGLNNLKKIKTVTKLIDEILKFRND